MCLRRAKERVDLSCWECERVLFVRNRTVWWLDRMICEEVCDVGRDDCLVIVGREWREFMEG